MQFELLDGRVTPRLTLIVDGSSKSGKTHTALSAPGPLGILSNDANTREIAQKWKRSHPDTVINYKEFFRSPLSEIDSVNEVKKHWTNYRDAYYAMMNDKSIRSVLIDTHTFAWEDCRLAFLGREQEDKSSEVDASGRPTGKVVSTKQIVAREYGEPMRDMREMVNAVGNKNLILICHSDNEWVNDKKTDRLKRKGMRGIEYLTQCEAQCFRNPMSGDFVLRMLSSTANCDIRGREGTLEYDKGKNIWKAGPDELVNEDISFQAIALSVYPSTSWEDWT